MVVLFVLSNPTETKKSKYNVPSDEMYFDFWLDKVAEVNKDHTFMKAYLSRRSSKSFKTLKLTDSELNAFVTGWIKANAADPTDLTLTVGVGNDVSRTLKKLKIRHLKIPRVSKLAHLVQTKKDLSILIDVIDYYESELQNKFDAMR